MSEPYSFTADMFGSRAEIFRRFLTPYVGKPNLRFLEVGTFEGRSALWLAENILTGKDSRILCVDTWQDNDELPGVDMAQAQSNFEGNVEAFDKARGQGTVHKFVGTIRDFIIIQGPADGQLDFAYIDGSHRASAALEDMVVAWPLLKVGCLLALDDTGWERTGGPSWDVPKTAAEAFLSCYRGRYDEVLNAGQLWLRKIR